MVKYFNCKTATIIVRDCIFGLLLFYGAVSLCAPLTLGSRDLESKELIYFDELKQIQENLSLWASKWSEGDFQSYIAFYSDQFKPEHLTYQQWRQQRKKRVHPLKQIQLSIFIESLSMNGEATRAVSLIIQKYRSRTYQDTVKKKIIWQYQHGEWKIIREQLIKP